MTHRDLHLQDALMNAEKLASKNNSLLAQKTSFLQLTETIINNVDTIVEGLCGLPSTLLHGDYWPGNINIHPTNGLTVFDWEDAAIGPAILDLVSFIQGSTWHFSPLPLPQEEIIGHYLNRLKIAGGRILSQKEFETQWDFAVMWTFINGWVRTLASLPESILSMRLNALQDLLFNSLQQAVKRRL
ncbi:MAG TPA: aminoglycoside phosphotransferase family protein, partial [Anaerolineales bacterium]|nr:aminoglycoside phosphotransferase family protein [Anaerolineales bacterium]